MEATLSESHLQVHADRGEGVAAEAVRAPVVIIQGNNDTRCPPRQVALYQERMKVLGKPCDVHWFDAGHMVGPVEQAIEHQEIFLRFAYSVLSSTPAHAPV